MYFRHTVRSDWVAERTENGFGGYEPTWEVARMGIPAAIQPASTSYALMGQQLRAKTSHVVTMRKENRNFVRQGGVLVYKDFSQDKFRYFTILGIYDMAENERYLKLECVEEQPTGYTDPALVGDT